MKIDEQRVPQDGRFDVTIDSRQVDLRVSTLPTVHGEKVVMRLLDKSEAIMTLEQLGVTGSNFDTLIANIKKPYGVILATGPTGSGKSTTLYAILSRISKPGVNVVTLEDPVEYELPGINQAQVKPSIGFTFAEGLRSVLRQDPNIIMVGEIRDLETAAMVTHAALTGHLVLSTLHTNDASGALPRLINMGVEPFLITSSINDVIGQRLVRKVCESCRERVEIPPAVKTFIKKQLSEVPSVQLKNLDLEQLTFYHGRGCPNCTNGYRGRIGIFEVLAMNEKIEELAIKKAPASDIRQAAIEAGMITMTQDGLIKALKGITTIDEVMRVTTVNSKELPGG
jgi:type IV pilus assembly protein PilB